MKLSRKNLFLELAKPNKKGVSRKVSVLEFTGRYESLQLGNGGSWCRDDGPLAKIYNIKRFIDGRKITSIKLKGLKKNYAARTAVKKEIIEFFKGKKCAVLDISSGVEVTYKDGRRDRHVIAIEKQKIEDFQPLSKAVRTAKRQHCKKCREIGKRFDATQIGFHKPYVKGHADYVDTCEGCYWYDPKKFIRAFNSSQSVE